MVTEGCWVWQHVFNMFKGLQSVSDAALQDSVAQKVRRLGQAMQAVHLGVICYFGAMQSHVAISSAGSPTTSTAMSKDTSLHILCVALFCLASSEVSTPHALVHLH